MEERERERDAFNLLLFVCLVGVSEVIKELSVHRHHRLEDIIDQSNDCPALVINKN